MRINVSAILCSAAMAVTVTAAGGCSSARTSGSGAGTEATAPVMTRAGLPGGPDAKGYVLLVSEEFDAPVDEKRWAYRLGRRGGEDPAAGWINALNRKENVTVSDGMMRIRHAREEIDGKPENTCGGLISRQRFGYGYYESRYKPLMLKGRGTHAAFWIRGINRTGGDPLEDPTRPERNIIFEIDSSEISSPSWKATNNLYVERLIGPDAHTDTWPHRGSVDIQPDAEGFVVDAFEYSPHGVIFYDNGREVARTGYNHLRGQQELWMTSLAGAHWREMDASELPGEALFDYFRFWAKAWPGHNLLANASFDYGPDREPTKPMGWRQTGDIAAGRVVAGSARTGRGFLRHAADTSYAVTTDQTLQHIVDGTYVASAYVRSSGGQASARLVLTSGGTSRTVDIPATPAWTKLDLPPIDVKGNTVTIAVVSEGSAGQWLEVDDVVLMTPPAKGTKPVVDPPFSMPTDPPYAIFLDTPQSFADGRHYLFERNTGAGEAITVSFTATPVRSALQHPVEKLPLKGRSGWSVEFTPTGELAVLVGSAADHTRIAVPGTIAPGKPVHITFRFDRGRATVFLDGKPVATRDNVPHDTNDKTAPGAIGCYWTRNGQRQSFDGTLADLRIYNRALTDDEIRGLATRK